MATYESRRVGANEFSFMGYPIQVIKEAYEYDDLDASYKFYVPIEAGVAVIGVAHRVTTAFAGGTPTIDIGDSSDDDGFVDNTEIAEGTLNNFAASFNKTNALCGGKYYAAADYISALGSTELTTGAGEIYVFYVDTRTNWRTE